MAGILTPEQVVIWKTRNLDWPHTPAHREVVTLLDSHEALREQDDAKVELIRRLTEQLAESEIVVKTLSESRAVYVTDTEAQWLINTLQKQLAEAQADVRALASAIDSYFSDGPHAGSTLTAARFRPSVKRLMAEAPDRIHGYMEGAYFVPDMAHPGTRDYVGYIRKEQNAEASGY